GGAWPRSPARGGAWTVRGRRRSAFRHGDSTPWLRAARAALRLRAPSARRCSAPAFPETTDAGSPSDQEQPVCGVASLLGVRVAEIFQEAPELLHLAGRNLHADQHAPVVGAVVAVVEQADVPVAAHAPQELHQRPRSLGEL